MSADDTRSRLLVRVKNNEPDAWLKLVKWIGPFIVRRCRRAGLQAADVEDVSQQVLQNIWTHLASFRKEEPGHSFRGWAYTLTRTRIADFRRQAPPRNLPGGDLPAMPDPSDATHLLQRAQFLVLQEILAQNANDPGFKAFYRTAVDGLTATAAGEELRMKAWTVRQHRSRWIKRLREKLRDEFGELLD